MIVVFPLIKLTKKIITDNRFWSLNRLPNH